MTYRKTWFSYVLWVIYTMLCIIFLVFAGNYVCISYLSDSFWSSSLSVPVENLAVQWFGFLMLPATVAVYWIIRGTAAKIRKKQHIGGERARKILECVIVLAFFTLGVFLRVMCALNYIPLQKTAENSAQNYVNGIEYFERAVVTAGGLVEPISYGGAYCYVGCLSFLLSFLGNKVASAVIFQVFLQVAGLVLAYGVTRKLAGRLPAGMILLYLSCSPAYLEMLKVLGPECFFFDLYLLIMLVAASYVKAYCGNRLTKVLSFAGALAAGGLIGMLAYLDLTAFTLLLVMTAVAVGKKKRLAGTEVSNSPGISVSVILLVLLSCVAGLCGTLRIFSLVRGTTFPEEIGNWINLQIGNNHTFGFQPFYPYSLDMLLFGALTVMATFLVFEFFRSGREQNYMLWILFCIVTAPTPLAVFGVQPFGLLSMYFWGVLAGLGLQNCIFGGKAKLVKTMVEQINQTAEEILQKKEEKSPEEENVQRIEDKRLEENTGTIAPENVEEDVQGTETENAEVSSQDEETVVFSKPRFLENPLPLPKKHVPRQMDYQHSVEDEDMKYDVEVREDDDFDI